MAMLGILYFARKAACRFGFIGGTGGGGGKLAGRPIGGPCIPGMGGRDIGGGGDEVRMAERICREERWDS
jgi:hypothetical protein